MQMRPSLKSFYFNLKMLSSFFSLFFIHFSAIFDLHLTTRVFLSDPSFSFEKPIGRVTVRLSLQPEWENGQRSSFLLCDSLLPIDLMLFPILHNVPQPFTNESFIRSQMLYFALNAVSLCVHDAHFVVQQGMKKI